jgi:hypothetical protein
MTKLTSKPKIRSLVAPCIALIVGGLLVGCGESRLPGDRAKRQVPRVISETEKNQKNEIMEKLRDIVINQTVYIDGKAYKKTILPHYYPYESTVLESTIIITYECVTDLTLQASNSIPNANGSIVNIAMVNDPKVCSDKQVTEGEIG